MATPKFSVSGVTTFHQSYEQDLACYREGGADGIGIWEFKLPEGQDADSVAKLRDSGLTAATCTSIINSIWPVPPLFPGPTDPEVRTQALCDAIRRFAPFEPELIICTTGNPPEGVGPDETRRVLVDGLRRAGRVAAEHGLKLGLEPIRYPDWSTIATIPETLDILDEIDEPSIGLLYDVYHLWDTPDVIDDTACHAKRVAPSIHISDWREPTRNDYDRLLPGDGIIDLPGLFGALDAGGWSGWVDVEVTSDDGTFTESGFEDSIWQQEPLDVVRRARAGFLRAWNARRAPGT